MTKQLEVRAMLAPAFQLLLEPHLAVIHSLFNAVDSRDHTALAKSLVFIFDMHLISEHCIMRFLREEVEHTQAIETLMRSNSIGIRLLSEFAKCTGRDYLYSMFRRPLDEITNAKSLEVNPVYTKHHLSEKQVQRNRRALRELCGDILEGLCTCVNEVPDEIRHICTRLRKLVETRFVGDPSAWRTAIGGFFFLRFICPAFVNPTQYGITAEDIDTGSTTSRSLVLITKILLRLSNGVEFKEDYMHDFDSFVESKSDAVRQLVDDLSQPVDAAVNEYTLGSLPSSASRLKQEAEAVYAFVKQHRDQIRDDLAANQVRALRFRLCLCLRLCACDLTDCGQCVFGSFD
jgi:hypothetical protein